MTKKDFIAVAEALGRAKPQGNVGLYVREGEAREVTTWRSCVLNLVQVFEDDNARFDKKRFVRACGIVEPFKLVG